MRPRTVPDKSSTSLHIGLEENFHRFWEPPKNEKEKSDKLECDEELEQVLYAYESPTNVINFRWQSVDPENSIYTVGPPNVVGPALYKRTYTLFPRPGFRQRKCCGCGPKPTLITILFLLLLILSGALIFLLIRSNEEKPIPVAEMGNDRYTPALDIGYLTSTTQSTHVATNEAVVPMHQLPKQHETRHLRTQAPKAILKLSSLADAEPPRTARRPSRTTTTSPRPHRSSRPPSNPHPQMVPLANRIFPVAWTRSTTSVPFTPSTTLRTLPSIPNPCFPFHCHRNGFCQNGTCRCKTGYEGDGVRVCANIDECVRRQGICGCTARCVDVPGSYECVCKPGYARIGDASECRDVDECSDINSVCPMNAKCLNVSGGFRCVCRVGFKWDSSKSTCLPL